jgi:DNA-binding beta-propeller fold protein YncE
VLKNFLAQTRRLSILSLALLAFAPATANAADAAPPMPQYKIDINWPKLPLPNNWTFGLVGGIFVDSRDHVYIYHSPSLAPRYALSAAATPKRGKCCIAAPHVVEFDKAGNVVRTFSGPGEGYDWPNSEHGLYVDYKGNVWLGGSQTRPGQKGEPADGMVLKFSPEGKFLMQIGGRGPSKGSTDTTQLSGAANFFVDPTDNEVYIADGYGNHRIIVFDADTGKFKRQWGAYGKPPTDDDIGPYDPAAKPAHQFRIAHCVRVSKDGFVYVCDRLNNRIQVFKKDGTYVTEWIYDKETLQSGSVGSIAFWPDAKQTLLGINDMGNSQIRFVNRADGKVVGNFGWYDSWAGELMRPHEAAFDSEGNLYTSEDYRVQKFTRSGGPPVK